MIHLALFAGRVDHFNQGRFGFLDKLASLGYEKEQVFIRLILIRHVSGSWQKAMVLAVLGHKPPVFGPKMRPLSVIIRLNLGQGLLNHP